MDKLISSHANVAHLNIRKEGPEDEKVLAIDIKFTDCVCPMPLFEYLLSSQNANDAWRSFWDHEENLRFPAMGPIPSIRSIDNCIVKIGVLVLESCELKKFLMTPLDGANVEMTFSISVKNPPEHATELLASMMSDLVPIVAVQAQAEMDFNAEADEVSGAIAEAVESGHDDELYTEALRYVVEAQKVSISGLQRGMNFGYNRAARLIERMEREGVVSPMDAKGGRKLLGMYNTGAAASE